MKFLTHQCYSERLICVIIIGLGGPAAARNTYVKVRWDEKRMTDPLVFMKRVVHLQPSI